MKKFRNQYLVFCKAVSLALKSDRFFVWPQRVQFWKFIEYCLKVFIFQLFIFNEQVVRSFGPTILILLSYNSTNSQRVYFFNLILINIPLLNSVTLLLLLQSNLIF